MTAEPAVESVIRSIRVPGRPRPAPRQQGAFIYRRISDPAEQHTLPMQERKARRYAEQALGLPVLEVFTDGMSGYLERPEYERMLRLARAGLCSHIVVYNFDRWGRETVTMLTDFNDLHRRNIEVHDVDKGRIDHIRAGHEAVRSEDELRNLSRRVLDGMIDRAENEEEYPMPRRAPTGYLPTPGEPAHPRKDPALAPLITQLFGRADRGESISGLTKWWNDTTGQHRSRSSIRDMLKNEYYAGIDVWNKRSNSKLHGRYVKPESEWKHRTHDQPLIDLGTFQRVQMHLGQHPPRAQDRTEGPRYSLTGLIYCATCDGHLRAHRDMRGRNIAVLCPSCLKARRYVDAEATVQQILRTLPIGTDAIAAAAPRKRGVEDVSALTGRIEKARLRRARLYIRRDDDDTDKADLELAIRETDEEIARLEAERKGAAEQVDTHAQLAMTAKWLSKLENWVDLLDPAKRTVAQLNAVYRQCIRRVVIDYAASLLTVEWLPAVAPLAGRPSASLPLPKHKPGPAPKQQRGQDGAG